MTLRVGWFSTGRGEGSRALLRDTVAAIESGLDIEIPFVFCNRERGEHEATDGFLDLVESFGLPSLTLSSRRFRRERGGALSKPGEPLPRWRIEYDRAVGNIIAPHRFDIGMLAGYMLIFSGEMAARHSFLNLHPAAPDGPTGTWQEVTWQLFDSRAAHSGVMVHLATEELDRGPPVTYCTYPLRGGAFDELWAGIGSQTSDDLHAAAGEEHPLFREIRRHATSRERLLVIETLRALAEGRVRIEGRHAVDGSGADLAGGLDLTRQIDAAVLPALAG
jgi:folate-dependent phosphoribosylglycinamide formyltransferase PurN